MNSIITEEKALLRLSADCARAEHCSHEMLERMRRWELSDEAQARVMQRLVADHYVDDERYALAFVRDKLRYNKWGRLKIEQALWQKHISEDIRQRALDTISTDDYANVLRPMLQQKRRSIRAASDYELRQKLMRFAMGRGFTTDVIRQCMDISDVEE